MSTMIHYLSLLTWNIDFVLEIIIFMRLVRDSCTLVHVRVQLYTHCMQTMHDKYHSNINNLSLFIKYLRRKATYLPSKISYCIYCKCSCALDVQILPQIICSDAHGRETGGRGFDVLVRCTLNYEKITLKRIMQLDYVRKYFQSTFVRKYFRTEVRVVPYKNSSPVS